MNINSFKHTGIVLDNIPAISKGVTLNLNISHFYGVGGISHQAVNVSLLEAGYSSTVMSVGGGWTTIPTTFIYGPYGGGLTGSIAYQEFNQ